MPLSKKQLAERRERLGSSEIPMVAGLYPGRTALDVYSQKVLGAGSDGDNRFTEWGNRLEYVVAQAAAKRLGLKVKRDQRTLIHPVEKWAAAHCDYEVLAPSVNAATVAPVLEIKTGDIHTSHQWGDDGTDEVPDRVLAQLGWQLWIKDAEYGYVAVLLGGNDLRVYRIARDRELEARLIEMGRDFMLNHVATKVPPPLDHTDSSRQLLAQLFPKHDANMIAADAETIELVQELQGFDSTLKPMLERQGQIENLLKAKIGEHAGLTLPGDQKVTWSSRRGNVSWKSYALALGANDEGAEVHRGDPIRTFNASWRRSK